MTSREIVTKNVKLAFEVIRQVATDPKAGDEVEALAADGTLILYDEADGALTEANDRVAALYTARGEPNVKAALVRRLSLVHR